MCFKAETESEHDDLDIDIEDDDIVEDHHESILVKFPTLVRPEPRLQMPVAPNCHLDPTSNTVNASSLFDNGIICQFQNPTKITILNQEN